MADRITKSWAVFDCDAHVNDPLEIWERYVPASKQDLVRKYGLVGIPMVDTRSKFYIPSTYGDWITIETRIESIKRSSFEVKHNVYKGDALAIEGFETRVLVGRDPVNPDKLKSAPFPPEMVAKFTGDEIGS